MTNVYCAGVEVKTTPPSAPAISVPERVGRGSVNDLSIERSDGSDSEVITEVERGRPLLWSGTFRGSWGGLVNLNTQRRTATIAHRFRQHCNSNHPLESNFPIAVD